MQFRSITQTAAIARHIPLGDERHPLLFRPLVEFALALPWRQLVRPDLDRVVQRRAMRGVLPEVVRLRRSKSSGTSVLLRGLREHGHTGRALAQARHLGELDLVDRVTFTAACEGLRHGLLAGQFPYLAAGLSLETSAPTLRRAKAARSR